jgi:hypothetical protein
LLTGAELTVEHDQWALSITFAVRLDQGRQLFQLAGAQHQGRGRLGALLEHPRQGDDPETLQ